MKKTLLSTVLASAFLLSGCNNDSVVNIPEVDVKPVNPVNQVKFAQFNLSFSVDGKPAENYEQWVMYMEMSPEEQEEAILLGDTAIPESEALALKDRIRQIQNVATIIQKNRPDVLLMNEFNNDGFGIDTRMLDGFQKNYLGVPQMFDGEPLEIINYPFAKNYATNTGNPIDFSRSQISGPNDTHGFGFYHGHYAFTLLSKFEIDHNNTNTFQELLRKEIPGATNPVIEHNCVTTSGEFIPLNDKSVQSNNTPTCGETYFSDDEWSNIVRMSSKNHVDAPIIIPTTNGYKVINVLLAHPTPSMADTYAWNNRERNKQENVFWDHYIDGMKFTNDNGDLVNFSGESFVIMGDMNADNTRNGEGGIFQLMSNPKVHQEVSQVGGEFAPMSQGGSEAKNPASDWSGTHPYPEMRTSTFGSRADYTVPSANLSVIDSGVYWIAEGESGHDLFVDPTMGWGTDKAVSSDHRMTWVTIDVSK